MRIATQVTSPLRVLKQGLRTAVLCLWLALPVSAMARDKFVVPTDQEDDPRLIHLIFDIDRTISDPHENGLAPDARRTIEAAGEKHRVANWVGEAMTHWSKNPYVRLSFISAGTRERNTELLKSIPLTDGSDRTLYDIAYRIVSIDELETIDSNAQNLSQRLRKDLRRVTRHNRNVVMADDKQFYLAPEQRKHLLWTLPTLTHYDTYEDAQNALLTASEKDRAWIPKTFREWFQNRHRMARIFHVIDTALNEHLANPADEKTELSDRVVKILKNGTEIELYESGMRRLNMLTCVRRYLGLR